MRIEPGEVFGLLGPNGAGKSTLVKILMTVIRPTTAKGTLLGDALGTRHTLARVGYLPEHHRMPEYLTGRQVIEHFGALSGVDRVTRKRRAGELLEMTGMTTWQNTRLAGYSKGMRQRIGIAQALVNNPAFVVLDEPTDGVDPTGRRDIRGMIQQMKQQGCAVLVNSHLLSELEVLSDRIAILVQGKVERQGHIHELTKADTRIELVASCTADKHEHLQRIAAAHGFSVVMNTTPSGLTNDFTFQRPGAEEEAAQALIDSLRAERCTIRSLHAKRPSLEDLFMQAVRDPSTGKDVLPGAAQRP